MRVLHLPNDSRRGDNLAKWSDQFASF